MLPKTNRLKSKKDFDRVFKEGKGFKEGPLFLKIAKNNLGNVRFGFVVSKKVSKKATLRNKLKRQMRELIRLRLGRIKKGIDGVLIISSKGANEKFQKLEKSLDKALNQAKILD
jgi:ribonuclease P protein component